MESALSTLISSAGTRLEMKTRVAMAEQDWMGLGNIFSRPS